MFKKAEQDWLHSRCEEARAALGAARVEFHASRGENSSSLSQRRLELWSPSTDTTHEFLYYRSECSQECLGTIECESPERGFFSDAKLRQLNEFSQTLIPWLRFKDQHRELFQVLDDAMENFVRSRSELGIESWSGIYLNASPTGAHLELGPYRGFVTEHHVIPLNRGLCGAAVSEGRTLVSGDVREDTHYLACSLETRSEIVIPLRTVEGKIWGELDLDSPKIQAYQPRDVEALERWAIDLSARVDHFFSINSLR